MDVNKSKKPGFADKLVAVETSQTRISAAVSVGVIQVLASNKRSQVAENLTKEPNSPPNVPDFPAVIIFAEAKILPLHLFQLLPVTRLPPKPLAT